TELVGKVEVGFIVRCRRKQNALALVFLDVLLDRTESLPGPVAEVVALIDYDNLIAPQIGQFVNSTCDRKHLCEQSVFSHVILPHLREIFWADDKGLREIVVLKDFCDRSRHECFPEADDITDK